MRTSWLASLGWIGGKRDSSRTDQDGGARGLGESGEGDLTPTSIGCHDLPAAPRSPIENSAGPGPILGEILRQIGPINWHNLPRAERVLRDVLAERGWHEDR